MDVTLVENPDIATTENNILSTIQQPLSPLFTNNYDKFSYNYPSDLNSSQKGHSVRFDILQVVPISLSQTFSAVNDVILQPTIGMLQGAVNTAQNTAQNVQNDPLKAVSDTLTAVSNIPGTAVDGIKALADSASKITPDNAANFFTDIGRSAKEKLDKFGKTKTIPSGSVTLYMPETLEFNYHAQYNNLSLSTAAGSLPGVGSLANAVTSYLKDNAAAKLGLNYAGYVFNPQEQLLFESIDFRSFGMSFTFTPFSRQEAQDIKGIIQKFRESAAPEIVNASAGFFFNPPSVFQITFLNRGQENPNINKLKRCVLENVDVNYAPNGWASHDDGAPVQTTLTLQFREIELVDKAAIKQGY